MPRRLRRFGTLSAAVLTLALGAVAVSSPAGASWRRPSGPNCGSAVYKPGGARWVCTFADEFSGDTLDTTKWTPVTTQASGVANGGGCFVASSSNIRVAGGYLELTARREPAPFTCPDLFGDFVTQYTEGQVASTGNFSQAYGRFAVRARFPAASVAGLQASLWLWPDNPGFYGKGNGGEIDIAEWYSLYPDRIVPALHYVYDAATRDPLTNTNVTTANNCLITPSQFHEYVLVWAPNSLTISYDGKLCLLDRYSSSLGGTAPFDQPFFVALTQALGSAPNTFAPATTPLPATTQIDWVHVWK